VTPADVTHARVPYAQLRRSGSGSRTYYATSEALGAWWMQHLDEALAALGRDAGLPALEPIAQNNVTAPVSEAAA